MENIEVIERGKITVNIYEGQKGDPGEPLRFSDLTQEQKAELKGEKGDPGTVPDLTNLYNELKYKGYKAKSASIEDVIELIVNSMQLYDKVSNSTFYYNKVIYGDKAIRFNISSAPNAELVERDTDNKLVLTSDNMNREVSWVLSKPIDENARYIDLIWDGEIRKTFTIEGVKKSSIPALINNPNYRNVLNDKYAIAVYDDGETAYIESTENSKNLTDIVELVNTANDELELPTNIKTLILTIGRPLSLDDSQYYPLTRNTITIDGDGGSVYIDSNKFVVDLRKLKVNCDNVVILMNQDIQGVGGYTIGEIYVISDKQKTISGATISSSGDSELQGTVDVSDLSVVQLTRNSVLRQLINGVESHL